MLTEYSFENNSKFMINFELTSLEEEEEEKILLSAIDSQDHGWSLQIFKKKLFIHINLKDLFKSIELTECSSSNKFQVICNQNFFEIWINDIMLSQINNINCCKESKLLLGSDKRYSHLKNLSIESFEIACINE
jgi:hypothetical protein